MVSSAWSEEKIKQLSERFPPERVKWKIQVYPYGDAKFAQVAAYIDARDVITRLNQVFGLLWSDDYIDLPEYLNHSLVSSISTRCSISVDLPHENSYIRIHRSDASQVLVAEPKKDNKTGEEKKKSEINIKDAHSDAFKRAAVKYGIGMYLYQLPKVKARITSGYPPTIAIEAQAELVHMLQLLEKGQQLPNFNDLQVDMTNYVSDVPEISEEEQKLIDYRDKIKQMYAKEAANNISKPDDESKSLDDLNLEELTTLGKKIKDRMKKAGLLK